MFTYAELCSSGGNSATAAAAAALTLYERNDATFDAGGIIDNRNAVGISKGQGV
jgi:hypothetical protein